MIALDITAKIGKSPKKPQVEIREDSDDNEQDSDEDTMESEAQELESADKGLKEIEFEEDEFNAEKTEGNPGWADAMQKILWTKKPKRKKMIVLSKAKKLCDMKKEKSKDVPFEIEMIKTEVKEEQLDKIKDQVQKPLTQLIERKKNNLGIRIKPRITDRDRERILQKIATKGVVQLFNAVRQQQGDISEKLSEAGPLERKREQVLKNIDKNSFLDILMGGSKSIRVDNDVKNESQKNDKNKEKDTGVWSVLRDDFVMGTKLKDWDRRSENEDSSAPEDMDSDN